MILQDSNYDSLPNIAKEKIIEDIISGKLKIGDKIREQDYAEKLKISRAPVREALLLLMNEGFAEKLPRKGTIVKMYSLEEIKDLYELRFYLEKQAIKKILNDGCLDKTLSELNKYITYINSEDDLDKMAKYNYYFHYQLIKSSGSRVLEDVYPPYSTFMYALQIIGYKKKWASLSEPIKDHNNIINDLQNKNQEGLFQILDKHCDDIIRLINKHIDQNKL